MAQRAKLSDVARLAGVSPATVSRVLNGNVKVAQELVDRVNRAREELGYRQNSLARGLRRQENNVVGVVIPDVTNPFFTDLVRGIEDTVRESGYLLVLCNSDETVEKETDYLQLLVDQHVAGIVIAPVVEESVVIPTLTATGIPIVTVDRKVTTAKVDSVTLDNVAGARELTLHLHTPELLAAGGRVAAITGPLMTTTAQERLRGYLAALAQLGIRRRDEFVVESDYSEGGGYASARILLDQQPRPMAIFSANNMMTLGVIRALRESQVDAGTIALASFDPLPWSADPAHRVTSLDVPTYEMGQRAARMVLDRIRDGAGPQRTLQLRPGHVR